MNVVQGNACELSEIHAGSGLGKASYILCCLPFVTLPEDVAAKVLSEIEKYMAAGLHVPRFSIRSRILHAGGSAISQVHA